MLSVVQAIYDMMGKYSEPTAEDITPSEHVERVFQVYLFLFKMFGPKNRCVNW